jgi:HAE1 family hydrophobic/amphiphilic exporter-1
MQISETCIRRPVMTTLITASLIVFGVFAYRLLAVAALPAVDFPTIQITATLPGASPETMAASVAGPIERQLSTIAGITSMTSTSALGTTSIIIQFELTRDIDGAALDVQTALTVAQRRLPIEMTTPPSFRKVNPGDFPILYISLVSPTLPLSTVDDYGEITLAQQISQLPGVAQVLVYGAQKFAVRVQVDPMAAASRGVSLDDIRNVVTKANSNTPVGTIAGVRQNTTITASAAMNRAADYRDVVVAYRNGAPIKLSEVAQVIDSVENDKIASLFNNERAIVLAIQRQPAANTVKVVDLVRENLPRYRAQIPAAVRMEVLNDRSVSIRDSVDDVEVTLLISIGLVVLVIFLFLRSVSATIIPALAVPISLIATCAAMYAFGFSINNMTLLALTLSVGFVVDDAIVMLENIVHHVDHACADRRVHSGAADGRHGRARVPRVRGVDRGRHHPVGFRLAHADADAVRARAQGASRGRAAEFRLASVRGGIQSLPSGLRGDTRSGIEIQVRDHRHDDHHDDRHGVSVYRDSEGLLSDRGYRLHLGDRGGAVRHFVQGDV